MPTTCSRCTKEAHWVLTLIEPAKCKRCKTTIPVTPVQYACGNRCDNPCVCVFPDYKDGERYGFYWDGECVKCGRTTPGRRVYLVKRLGTQSS